MIRGINEIASSTIAKATYGKELKYPDGKTPDIVAQILECDKIAYKDTKSFAPYLKEDTLDKTLRNVWLFVKTNIIYKIDPLGYQFIKTPARTWADKTADCKSLSIFVASILRNLGIPFNYRFVSFRSNPTFTHVYVVVKADREYILDCVMPVYDKEKAYTFKKDYNMTKIYQMSGLPKRKAGHKRPAGPRKWLDLGHKPIDQITPGEMDLLVARDRFKTGKHIAEKLCGIGSLVAEKHQDTIDMLDDAIDVLNDPNITDKVAALDDIADDATSGVYSIAKEIAGIGDIGKGKAKRQAKKAQRKANKAQRKENRKTIKATPKGKERRAKRKELRATEGGSKTRKFLKKVAKGAAKGLKAITKVATAPQRMAVKAILEVSLPKAAPFFLYLFITDPAIIAKLPAKVARKRKKSEKIADFIVGVIGMKRAHFMEICRNGIRKQYKKQPEQVISEMMKGKLAGIGVITAIIEVVVKIIGTLVKLFKKKKDSDLDVSSEDAPDPENDFEGTESENEELADEIKNQKSEAGPGEAGSQDESENDSSDDSGSGEEDATNGNKDSDTGNNSGRSAWNSF